ncbi:O-antigen ligase family protein [Aureibaculum algae]|uniref:O-antigen ligase family protein n=1 Tax=Aureibaculum algae TaxID=2584122 RepID=A0A5B7TL54_9FLAO|nr:O-antigen ligase family protein [Aureibaculum algae]QCX37005.1 O-antigen ligase family protein [Aureibaculum algae]
MKDILDQNKSSIGLMLLLFLVAFSLPFSFAFNSISLAALFLYSFIYFKKDYFLTYISNKKVYLFYLLFFIVQSISIYYSNNKELAIKVVTSNILFLIVPITFVNLKNKINEIEIKIAYSGLLIAVLLNLINSYFNIIRKSIFESMDWSNVIRENFIRNSIYEIHVPYLALLVVFLIICSYKIKIPFRKRSNIIIRYSLMAILILSLFLLSGIMAILILILFFIVQFLCSENSKKTKLFGSILVIIGIISSFLLLKHLDDQKRIRGSENIVYRAQKIISKKDPVREVNWKSVVKVISSNVIWGVGADGGIELLQKERPIMSESYINKHNAHNDYLEIVLRYGIVGICIYLIILGSLIKTAFTSNNYYFRWFLIVFMISSLTESYLQRQVGLVFFVFFSLLFYTQSTYRKIDEIS